MFPLPLSHLTTTVCAVDREEAEEEASNLLLDKESSGQVRLAFCPLTTTRLAPALLVPPLPGWSDCINESMPFLLSSSVAKIQKNTR